MLPLPLSQILDPTLTGLGRLPARANLTPYPDEVALQERRTSWRQELDGRWRFQLLARPAAAPVDWTTQTTDAAPWREIDVPGVWTRQDTGDLPHYANWQMPFACQKPPAIPEDNPTGLYRTDFEAAADWGSERTILHVGGFESLAMVWCNGKFVGLAKDSRLPSEFELSSVLQDGTNQLAIMVMRWCDATWIEDQDHWNHGGLHRSVWLETRPEVSIEDLVVDTDFDATTGVGSANVRVAVTGASEDYAIAARLEDADGTILLEAPQTAVAQFDVSRPPASQWKRSFTFDGYAAALALKLDDVDAWSAERPTRYRLVTRLIAPNGACVEAHETWIGFTRVEVKERRLWVNGRPIIVIGVNRHDHHPENGKTCSREDFRAELVTMKRHNINAIRTAHYPNDPVLLDLADELGFYVIDEANVECHARWTEVAQHPGYHGAIIERTTRMIARDRNHPCIIGWSLGNEAGHGPAHDAAAAAARRLDPGRFVHYEGAVAMRFSFPFGRSPETTHQTPSESERVTTDLVCPMYAPIDHIVEWARWAEDTAADDRPLVLCEYSHAMGNSNGSIAAYVDAFFAEPALAGGFVWDWRDQGLAERDEAGRFFWGYGGHYGDEPNDANFNINGLVGPDGTPHPALREYMWAARPVRTEYVSANEVRCHNRRVFEDTSDLVLAWSVLRNGIPVEQGQMPCVIAPGETQTVSLPIETAFSGASEWHINIEWRLHGGSIWAPAGHLVAWDQFSVTPGMPVISPHSKTSSALRVEAGQIWRGDVPVFASPITPCVWRAPTDNDGGKPGTRPLFQSKTAEWVDYGLHALAPSDLTTRPTEEGGVEEQDWRGANDEILQHHRVWSVQSGRVRIDETIMIPGAWRDLPRVGVRFELDAAYQAVEWFGLGPDESYPDRCGAQTVGVWQSAIADQYHPYVRPQEYGAHEQCRWVRVTDADGEGVEIVFPEWLSVTVRPHHDVDLNAAETLAELRARPTSEMHIDVAMRGLGTAACGPDALPQFRVGPGTYKFSWWVGAISRV
ncbi:MAG: glycoside hydrolase family 2 TIM barrel-domain containing protein [Pseudomonadota bacterium]